MNEGATNINVIEHTARVATRIVPLTGRDRDVPATIVGRQRLAVRSRMVVVFPAPLGPRNP
jgi:hypothetical protein